MVICHQRASLVMQNCFGVKPGSTNSTRRKSNMDQGCIPHLATFIELRRSLLSLAAIVAVAPLDLSQLSRIWMHIGKRVGTETSGDGYHENPRTVQRSVDRFVSLALPASFPCLPLWKLGVVYTVFTSSGRRMGSRRSAFANEMRSLRPENDVIQDFRRHTDPARPRKDVWCPNSSFEKSDDLDFFLPENQLKEYFDRHLEEILYAVSEDSGLRLVEPRLVRDGYLKIFAILLRIKREAWINYFLDFPSLNDSKLPFEDKPYDFPAVTEDDRFFWTSFNKWQWIFCPPEIRYKPSCKWNSQIVLPIIFKQRIGSGSSVDTYKIRIHPDYNHLRRLGMVRFNSRLSFL